MAATEVPDERAFGVAEGRTRLRQAVLQTELRPGGVYSQDEVRKLLEVGRTPFREALRMVQAEKLIDILPNGRLQVPELSMDDFTQVQIARIALETAAARISIPLLDPEDLAHLEGFMAQMTHYLSSEHFDRVEAPHLAFHRGLIAGAGSKIQASIEELSDRIGRYRWTHAAQLQDRWHVRTAEHRAILDAAIAGDAEGVVAQLVRHYLETGLFLAEAMEEAEGAGTRERFQKATMSSLAPGVRSAVSKLK